jgi:hypothetical protein
MPGPRDPNPLTGFDPGGNLDIPAALAQLAARTGAHGARLLGDAPIALARRADSGLNELPEGGLAHLAHLAVAAAGLAGVDGGAGLGAVALAVFADGDRLEDDLAIGACEDVGKLDLDLDPDVAA